MKTLLTNLIIVLLTTLPLVAKEVTTEDLIGTWNFVEVDDPSYFPVKIERFDMTFSKPNAFLVKVTMVSEEERTTDSRTGTFSVSSNKLTTHTKEEDLTETFDVKIESDHLYLHLPDSATMTLMKEKK